MPCPCYGDHPSLGADANAVVVTTNIFEASFGSFGSVGMYTFSKSGLEAGAAAGMFAQIVASGSTFPYSLVPATIPPGGAFEARGAGTEYLTSAFDPTMATDNRIALWALSGTSTINSHPPSLTLSYVEVGSETYGQPPSSTEQRSGPTPLGVSLSPPEPRETISCGFPDATQVATFAQHKVWAALNTGVVTGGEARCGIAYFAIKPVFLGSGLAGATMSKQGYIAVNNGSVINPALAVNSDDDVMIGFTLTGAAFWPSAGYAQVAPGKVGKVHVGAAGTQPEDGFMGYRYFGGNGEAIWGSYSGAAVDESGNMWWATEMIPNLPRGTFANWGTAIGSVAPDANQAAN